MDNHRHRPGYWDKYNQQRRRKRRATVFCDCDSCNHQPVSARTWRRDNPGQVLSSVDTNHPEVLAPQLQPPTPQSKRPELSTLSSMPHPSLYCSQHSDDKASDNIIDMDNDIDVHRGFDMDVTMPDLTSSDADALQSNDESKEAQCLTENIQQAMSRLASAVSSHSSEPTQDKSPGIVRRVAP